MGQSSSVPLLDGFDQRPEHAAPGLAPGPGPRYRWTRWYRWTRLWLGQNQQVQGSLGRVQTWWSLTYLGISDPLLLSPPPDVAFRGSRGQRVHRVPWHGRHPSGSGSGSGSVLKAGLDPVQQSFCQAGTDACGAAQNGLQASPEVRRRGRRPRPTPSGVRLGLRGGWKSSSESWRPRRAQVSTVSMDANARLLRSLVVLKTLAGRFQGRLVLPKRNTRHLILEEI